NTARSCFPKWSILFSYCSLTENGYLDGAPYRQTYYFRMYRYLEHTLFYYQAWPLKHPCYMAWSRNRKHRSYTHQFYPDPETWQSSLSPSYRGVSLEYWDEFPNPVFRATSHPIAQYRAVLSHSVPGQDYHHCIAPVYILRFPDG